MIRLGLLLTLVVIVLWIYTIFDSITAETEKVRTLQKPLWVLIVLLLAPFGSVAWLIWGRPRVAPNGGGGFGGGWSGGIGRGPFGPTSSGPSSAGPSSAGPGSLGPRGRTKPRPIAPDDDPDFLRSL